MDVGSNGSCETKMNSLEKSSMERSRIEELSDNVDHSRNVENELDSSIGSLDAINKVEIDNPLKNNGSILKEESYRENNDSLHDDPSIYSPDLSSSRTVTNNKLPDLMRNDAGLVECPVIVKCDNVDNDFVKDLPLTGDPEIDEEIIAFYRAKRSGGIY